MCIRAQLVTCTTCVLMHSARTRSNYTERVSHETKRGQNETRRVRHETETRPKRGQNETKTRRKRGANSFTPRSHGDRERAFEKHTPYTLPLGPYCTFTIIMFHCQSNQYYTHSHSHHLCPDTWH